LRPVPSDGEATYASPYALVGSLRLEDSGQFGRINLEAPVILPLRRKPACPDGAPDVPLAARSDSWRTKLRNTKPAEWPDSQVDG
jgi:hypothetical protein